MAELIYADLVEETTSTTGTGAITPSGAVDGSRSFAAVLSEGDQFYYSIDGAPADTSVFEVGIGTYTSGTIERAPIVSSAGTSAVNLPAGTKTVALTVAAEFYQTVQANDVFAAWQAIPGNEGLTVTDFLNQITGADGLSAPHYTIETETPPDINSGWSQEGVIYDTPNRDEGGEPSSIRFGLNFSYNPVAANAQYSGQPEYTNNVVGISWNLNPSFVLLNTDMGGPSIRIESRFKVPTRNPANPGGWVDGSEFHHSMYTTGSGGTEYRPISIYAPFDNADWGYDSGTSFQAASYAFADGYRNVHVSFAWAGTSTEQKQIFLSNQVRVNRDGNGSAWLYQQNVGGALVPLPFISAQNHLQISQPIYAPIAASSLANPLGIQSLFSLQGTSGFTTGARMVYMTTNAITGSGTGYEADLSASTRFEGFKLRNSHASGHSGGRIVGNGNLYLDFYRETAFKRWGMGLRSDDTFAIGQQAQGVEVADAIRINFTTLQTQFMKAPKLPSATVAGAGSAATAGAGALHYVTDLNATTTGSVAAGSGSNNGVVVSDGTDWRIMAAW
ncbi:hypothetical protein [Sphingomonas sp.]|uniref:hypothetical protein n=1 Tax=Sphingomonas sp. TaxID=28214 RepID=UPI0017B9018B|nr:hypothetical protein [Sphingomonas sp.]MBA4761853.1 hypothetical protein [Sphingomonas sp.]